MTPDKIYEKNLWENETLISYRFSTEFFKKCCKGHFLRVDQLGGGGIHTYTTWSTLVILSMFQYNYCTYNINILQTRN